MSEIVQNLLVRPMACIKEIIHSGQMLWKRYYDSRICIENLVNDNKIDTTDQYMFHLTANKEFTRYTSLGNLHPISGKSG